MSSPRSKTAIVAVDSRGFVYAEGVQLGKLTGDRRGLIVVDKDKKRSQARGSRYVTIPICELGELAKE